MRINCYVAPYSAKKLTRASIAPPVIHFSLIFPDCFSINALPKDPNPPGLGKFAPNFSIDFNKYTQNNIEGDVIKTVSLCQSETRGNCPDTSLAYVVRKPEYDGRVGNGDDVALIILPEGQKITTITPVTLNRDLNVPVARQEPEIGDKMEVFGWGATCNGNSTQGCIDPTPNEIRTGMLEFFIDPGNDDLSIMFGRTNRTDGVATGGGDSGTCNF
jgi:hypothetical protein